MMNQHERDQLDRHITGNYGEDQFTDSVADCFNCKEEYDTNSGEIALCQNCDEPICINCRKIHQDGCGKDCLS